MTNDSPTLDPRLARLAEALASEFQDEASADIHNLSQWTEDMTEQ